VPRERRPAAARQETESVVEALRDLIRREHAYPRCRQLDCQRHPIEPASDLENRVAVRLIQREPWLRCLRAVHEQLHGFGADERRHQPGDFAGHAERFATRGQDADPRTLAEQRFHHRGTGVDDMLAVVENE
jgi:hypothetical protein